MTKEGGSLVDGAVVPIMRTIRKRRIEPVDVGSSNVYDQRRIAEMKQAKCPTCDSLWPWSMLREKDGIWYCPNDYEINAREGAEMLANDVARGAQRPTRWLTIQPPQNATTQSPVGAITSITTSGGVAITQRSRLYFRRGGPAQVVLLGGQRLSSSDTIAYSSGLSDSVAPVITETQITLTIIAAGGATPSDYYNLTFNGSAFRGIFGVR